MSLINNNDILDPLYNKEDGYWHHTHQIPLGSLVEVSDGEYKGVRLFVVNHSRDVDGTPLYDLHFSSNYASMISTLKDEINDCYSESVEKQLRKIYNQLASQIKEANLKMI